VEGARPIFARTLRPVSKLVLLRLFCNPYSFAAGLVLFFFGPQSLTRKGAFSMEWTTPRHDEIDLNCEVSSYANAEL
jgi:hypothetical protein